MFVINDIISFEEANGEKQLERILWIDEGNVICYTINIENEKALPIKRKVSDLQQLFNDQLLTLVDNDPYAFVYQDEKQISDKNKTLRDERWKSIESMVLQEPDIYERDKRGQLVRFSVENTGKNKRLFYKYMVQYWQRGKVKSALLPNYTNSGGRGKEKTYKDQKNGRRRKFETIIGKGVIVTDEIKRTFEVGVKRFYHTVKKIL